MTFFLAILAPYTVASTVPVVVDPETLNIILDVTFKFNSNITTSTADELATLVSDTLSTYNSSTLGQFEGLFRHSKVTGLIDNTDNAILNNNLNIRNAYVTSSQALYNVLLMGKSTGDLTMWARQYVVTENTKYKKAYEDHLIVRSGNRADDNGIKKSYDQRFKDIPTTIVPESDKQKLLDSLSTSDLLAVKETEAFKLVEDGKRDEAIDLLFNDEYDVQKEKIVTPLIDFTRKMQLEVGKKVVTKLYFSYGYIILLCI